jgi:hypothetical protein
MRTLLFMRTIKRGALEQFWQAYPDAKASLEAWYGVVRKATWKTLAEMKQVYHNADLVGRRTRLTPLNATLTRNKRAGVALQPSTFLRFNGVTPFLSHP